MDTSNTQNSKSIEESFYEMTYKKSNSLIFAKGRSTLLMNKLFAISIISAQQNTKGHVFSDIPGTQLRALFKNTNGSFYTQLKMAVEGADYGESSLLDWRIITEDPEKKEFDAINVVTDCSFKNGILHVAFNDKIAPYVYNLQNNYTVLPLQETMAFTSIYSYKLFEVCMAEIGIQRYRGKHSPYIKEIDLIQLKLLLGIIDPKENPQIVKALKKNDLSSLAGYESMVLPSYTKFRKNVLERACSEINELSSIHVDYKPIKKGRGGKVVSVRFIIYDENNLLEEDDEPEQVDIYALIDEVRVLLASYNLSTKEIVSIIEAADNDIERIKLAVPVIYGYKRTITSVPAFLIQAIKEHWTPGKSKKHSSQTHNKNTFRNFDERDYDYVELEKKLLNKRRK